MICEKADGTPLWDQKRGFIMKFMQQGTTIMSSILQKTKETVGSFRIKGVEC
jgi:hypothetical protein